jgi:transposase InsO family protein
MHDRMTKEQEKRLTELYYGSKTKPGATYGPRVLYRMMLKEGDTPNVAAVRAWVKDQTVDQLFAFRRTDGEELSPNKMTVPMAQMGMDLFTVTNQVQKKKKNETAVTETLQKLYKDYGANGFVLLVVDHYSRYAFTAHIRNKSDKDIAKVLPALLDKAEAMGRAARPDLEANQRAINSMRSDNGGEFKGQVLDILKERKIKNIKTLSGTPQSNAIVERTVGTIRRNLAKQFIINPRSWRSLLVGVTDVYNKKYNRTIKQTPHEAAQDTTSGVQEARRAEEREQQKGPTKSDRDDFKVGQRVLLRIKDKQFNKSSGQTYYKTPLKIATVKRARDGVRATRYTLESADGVLKDSQKMLEKVYPRRNLLPIGQSMDPDDRAKIVLMRGIK